MLNTVTPAARIFSGLVVAIVSLAAGLNGPAAAQSTRTNVYNPSIQMGLKAAGVLNPAVETFKKRDLDLALDLYRAVYSGGARQPDEPAKIRAFRRLLRKYAAYRIDKRHEGRTIRVPSRFITRRKDLGNTQTFHRAPGYEAEIYTYRFPLKNNPPSEMLRNSFTRARNANILNFFQSNRAFVANLHDARLSSLTGKPYLKMRYLRTFTKDGYITGLYIVFNRVKPPRDFEVPDFLKPLQTFWTPPSDLGTRLSAAYGQPTTPLDTWTEKQGLEADQRAELAEIFTKFGNQPPQAEIDAIVRGWIWRRMFGTMAQQIVRHFEATNRWHTVKIADCQTPRDTEGKPYRDVRIVFATNRTVRDGLKNETPNARSWFGTEADRANTLEVGCAYISVPLAPETHTLLPTQFQAGWLSDPAPLPADDAKLFRVLRVKHLDTVPATASAQRLILDDTERRQYDNERRALVFIHGYNTSFENALLRIAQFAASINYPGRVYLFSWPSAEQTRKYMSDMESAERSETHLSGFLRALFRDRAIRTLDVIAHSMGSQLTIRALGDLRDLFYARDDISLGQLIFAASDVSPDVFTEKMREISYLASGITLYGSVKDKALLFSQTLRGAQKRLGQLVARNEVEFNSEKLNVIDATTPSNICNGWGYADIEHNYFGSNPALLTHIQSVLDQRTGAVRTRLRQIYRKLIRTRGVRKTLELPEPECWWNPFASSGQAEASQPAQ